MPACLAAPASNVMVCSQPTWAAERSIRQDVFGYALHLAQDGRKHEQAKPLKGFGGAGVLKMVEDHRGDTYRAVYTVKFQNAVYVLHCFQKKSAHDIETPKPDMDLIRARLKAAQTHAEGASA